MDSDYYPCSICGELFRHDDQLKQHRCNCCGEVMSCEYLAGYWDGAYRERSDRKADFDDFIEKRAEELIAMVHNA